VETYTYGTASIFISSLTGNTLTTATGDTGVSTSSRVWLQGIQPGNKATPSTILLVGSTFSSNYGANWTAELRVLSQTTLTNVAYVIGYYSK
jgi:hypothetical protein